MRTRSSVLGDLIHMRPVYIGPPDQTYSFDNYIANFKTPNASRTAIVALGANDGMLHILNASTGNEIMAFVPSKVIPNLSLLTADPYTHQYYVDGGLTSGDVFFSSDSTWHTVLVGGLGAGGQEFFAIDITDPSSITNEGVTMRTRSSVLGDLIHMRPVYIGHPDQTYSFDNYIANFKTPNASRTAIVALGANDGMLHILNASTGNEIMAFVPSKVIPNLSLLTADPYTHQYYVDGGLTSGDVFFSSDSTWHTVLVGGLGAGGQEFFAIDITDPSSITNESTAAGKILWEFTDDDDSDLGFTYSRPSIVRLQDGTWAAIVANGYANTTADGTVSTTGDAVLYIINIETGALIKKIPVNSGDVNNPNGLSSPTAINVSEDSNIDADYVYAGDIDGNMWRFDLTDNSSVNWGVSYSPDPLFTATDGTNAKAITTPPTVSLHPNWTSADRTKDYLVFFGTGRMFETSDGTSTQTQSIYGIWDAGSALGSSPTLLSQTLTEKTHSSAGGTRVRVSSTSSIDWTSDKGWETDLPTTGERLLTTPIIRDGRVQLTTMAINASLSTGAHPLLRMGMPIPQLMAQ